MRGDLVLNTIIGIILLAIVLAAIFFYAAGVIRHGPCWGSVEGNIAEIKSSLTTGLAKTVSKEIKTGDCLGSVILANSEKLNEIQRQIDVELAFQCDISGGQKAFIVAVPYFGVSWEWLSPSTWLPSVKDGVENWISEKRGIRPVCKGMDKKFNTDMEVNTAQLIKEGKADYKVCIKISSGENYIIESLKAVPGGDKC